METKQNYDRKMEEIRASFAPGGRPRLLLHACCAPCASVCLERLTDSFDVTVFFFNPNITDGAEFEKRESEMRRFLSEAPFCRGVNLVTVPFDPQPFWDISRTRENDPERGGRCLLCYALRLRTTAETAKQGGFDFFTTTLTLSPLKDSQVLNEIGGRIAAETGVPYLFSDFGKRNGYVRSLELSRQYGLYRQNYCGCVFSRRETSSAFFVQLTENKE